MLPRAATDPRFTLRERRPGLDLLRALALVLVIFYHAGLFGFSLPHEIQRFGWVGVDLFFVLSGYLIGGQLVLPIARGQKPDLRRFFWRRALRILPAYFAVMAVYLLAPGLREYVEMPPAWKFFTFVQNIGLHGGTAFSHAWSLCVEAQFYLALPVVIIALARWPRAALSVTGGLIIGGMVLRATIALVTAVHGTVPFRAFQSLIYYPTWSRLDPLILGVSLAAIERFRSTWWSRLNNHAGRLGVGGCGAIIYGLYLGESKLTLAVCVWQFPLIAFGAATFLVCAVSSRLPFHRRAVPGAALIASIAYSVYLGHKLAIHFVQNRCIAHDIASTSVMAMALWLTGVALAGFALFFTVERPFLRFRQARARTS